MDGFTLMSYIRIDKQQRKTSNLPMHIYRVVRHLVMTFGVSIYRNRSGMMYYDVGSQPVSLNYALTDVRVLP